MVDTSNPIDPYGHLKVEKIEEVTSADEKEKKLNPKSVDKKKFIYLTFLNFFLNTLNLFNKKKYSKIEDTPIFKELQTIKSSLESLKEKDLSKEADFLNFFAYLWLKLFNDYKNYHITNEKTISDIKELIKNIYSYPEGSEFSLGYYISELAGMKWIPFPYIELLKNLHLEYKKDPINSHLQKWIDLLNSILEKV